jgi:hypothetical protein
MTSGNGVTEIIERAVGFGRGKYLATPGSTQTFKCNVGKQEHADIHNAESRVQTEYRVRAC